MKSLLTITSTFVFLALSSFPLLSQSTVTYTYDSSGNRIRRQTSAESGQLSAAKASNRNTTSLSSAKSTTNPKGEGVAAVSQEAVSHIHSQDTSVTSDSSIFAAALRRGSIIFTEDEKVAHQENLEKSFSDAGSRRKRIPTLKASSLSELSQYDVGEITLEEGVSPSGGRTYRIPIAVAPHFPMSPSISIAYNSQAAEGWAGYGWDIQGLSAITLINKGIYYHGEPMAADVNEPDAVFALDGVPLVANDDSFTSGTFPLSTASGHIVASPILDSKGFVRQFRVLFPDGRRALYGTGEDLGRQRVSYPLTEISDRDGDKIEYVYRPDVYNDIFHLTDVHFGFDSSGEHHAEISLYYDYVSGYPIRFFAGKWVYRDHRLSSITCRCDAETVREYSFSYKDSDNVTLLSRVDCLSHGSILRPLIFSYGDDNEEGEEGEEKQGTLLATDSLIVESAFSSSSSTDIIYKRGKFIRREFKDGLVSFPAFPTYSFLKKKNGHYKFGSPYPENQTILVTPVINSYINRTDETIKAGAGFQTIDAVDVDGDGTDEIVKVNLGEASASGSVLTITIYRCGSSLTPSLVRSFSVTLSGSVKSGSYYSPCRREYYWGDFSGYGRAQLLAVCYDKNYNGTKDYSQPSIASLIDIYTSRVVSEQTLFQFSDESGRRLITSDIDGDSRTELCFAPTADSLNIYHLNSGTFTKDTTITGQAPYLLADTTRACFITDLNGDGISDIVFAPASDKDKYWSAFYGSGAGFMQFVFPITTRSASDRYIFTDINRDGLADLVRVNGRTVGAFININGRSFSDFHESPSKVSGASGIIPANTADYSAMSAFIKADGHRIRLFSWTAPAPDLRTLTRSDDSFSRSVESYYSYLPDHSLFWSSDTLSVSNFNGYSVRPLPLYVLSGEKACASPDASPNSPLRERSFIWRDPVVHSQGLGFRGFASTREIDRTGVHAPNGRSVISEAFYDTQRMGVITSLTKRLGSYSAPPFFSVSNAYDSHATVHGRIAPRLTKSVYADSLSGVTTTVQYTYDSYDFPASVNTSRSLGDSVSSAKNEKVTFSYSHHTSPSLYVLGGVSYSRTVREGDGDSSSSWKEEYSMTYDSLMRPVSRKDYVGLYVPPTSSDKPRPLPDSLLRDSQTSAATAMAAVRPIAIDTNTVFETFMKLRDTSLLVRETRWSYDAHGNVVSETSAPYGATVFTGESSVYDSLGRTILSHTDALGHTTRYAGHGWLGQPATATDWKGRVTRYTYDNWGRTLSTKLPDGSAVSSDFAWGGSGLYTITLSSSAEDTPVTVTHYDALNRAVRSATKTFDGRWRLADTEYDAIGRVSRVSLPYRSDSSSTQTSSINKYWSIYAYDAHSRPTSLNEASGRVTSWTYAPSSVTVTKDGVTSTRVYDAIGNLISAADSGGVITYSLRDDGRPSSVSISSGGVTRLHYDLYGRRIHLHDQSAGDRRSSYRNYPDGSSSTTQAGPKGGVSTRRDRFGRTLRVDRTGEFSSDYAYNDDGFLTSITSSNGTGASYAYDSMDRLSSVRETAPDGSCLLRSFSYTSHGALSSVTFSTREGVITTEAHTYANGYDTALSLPDGTLVRRLTSENELGQPNSLLSQGVIREYAFSAYGLPASRAVYKSSGGDSAQAFQYDFNPATGDMTRRSDALNGTSEDFAYDALNRLVSASGRTASYDAKGNLLSLDGVGGFTYSVTASPYRLTSLAPETAGLVPSGAQTVSYASFDRPASISEGGVTASFTYNDSHDRVGMVVTDSTGATILNRTYLGGRYERDVTPSDTTERFWLGEDAYSAPAVLVRSSGGGWTFYNIGRDCLGSVTHVLSSDGDVVAEYSYDPWGRLRNPVSLQPYTSGQEPQLFLGRGFSGHEHLRWFSLINMNARLYDPLTTRFLSSDPLVQDPGFSQDFNRYAYALNNPLKYTDPDGEFALSTMFIVGGIGAALFGLGNLAAHSIRGDDLGQGNWAKYFFTGAAAGFLAGSTYYAGWQGILWMTQMTGFLGGVGNFAKTATEIIEGVHAATTATGMIGGAFQHGWKGVANSGKLFLGNFYLDENSTIAGSMAQGFLRHTWETLQTGLGYDYSQVRNAFGSSIDRVDYLGGVTFATNENSGKQMGITIGNFANMDIYGTIKGDFEDDITTRHPIFMHEYGHTIDSRRFGPSYLFAIGIPSLLTAKSPDHKYQSYEMRANRNAARYFRRNYGVLWYIFEHDYPIHQKL